MIKKPICLFLSFALVICLTGCKGYRETENVYIVTALGFDYYDKYYLSAEVVSAGGNEIKTEPFAEIYKSSGKTPEIALYSLRDRLPKSLMFNHCTAVIIGGDTTQREMEAIFSFCENMHELNLAVYIMKAKDSGDILEKSRPVSLARGFDIAGLITEMEEASGIDTENRFYLCHKALLNNEYYTIPKIKFEEEKIKVSGNALYKGKKFLTDLSIDEGLIFSVLSNKSGSGVFLLEDTRAQVDFVKTRVKTNKENEKDYLVDMYISKEMKDFCETFEKKGEKFLRKKGKLAGLEDCEIKVVKRKGI